MEGERDYWSISEVLARLRDEFPDVTISKIRFLESKGLLDLERTPSGYRKFYQHDVERLKAVLLIQKETFMPLKVIRDHLGDRDGEARPSQTLMFEPTVDEPHNDSVSEVESISGGDLPGPTEESSAPSTDNSNGGVELDQVPESITRLSSAVRASVKKLHSAEVSRPGIVTSEELKGLTEGEVDQDRIGELSADRQGSENSDAVTTAKPGREDRSARQGIVGSRPPTQSGDRKFTERQIRQPEGPKRSHAAQAADVQHEGSDLTGHVTDGQADFTVEEITKLTGARIAEIAEMVEFGLISGHNEFGETVYSSEELALIRIVLRFRSFGIEARHLRLYKTSAEREFGFLEQVVAPIFKKRNPVATEQAKQILLELRSLGGTMREAFLSKELSKYLG